MADITVELEAPEAYDLRRTMAASRMGKYDPTLRLENGAMALALGTPEGAASLAVEQRGRKLTVHGFGEGAPWLVPHASKLLGLEDKPETFEPDRGVVRKLWRQYPGIYLPTFPRIVHRVVQVTLLQLVTWQEACSSWGKLVRKLGAPVPGPVALRLPPDPRTLASTPDYALVALGVRPKQARTIRRVAKYASRIEEAASASTGSTGAETFAQRLAAIHGIGPWTIAYVQGTALGAGDALLLGDYNLPNTIAYLLAGEERASEERMVELPRALSRTPLSCDTSCVDARCDGPETRASTGALMRRLAIIIAVLAVTSATSSVQDSSTHVNASRVDWDPQPNLPDVMKEVVRWKTLVGTDTIPQQDFSFGELELAPRAIYPGHLHPSPGMYDLLEGRVESTVGDETFIAALDTPPNTMHHMVKHARTVWAWWAPGRGGSVMATRYRLTEPLPEQSGKARFPDAPGAPHAY
ncbi:MAG: hypothetical protein E2P02_24330 [Acidobacteria bacterium]|nr:MAG: hypothetical protein E2P02_24330 [Acidobacteriota bacterium]